MANETRTATKRTATKAEARQVAFDTGDAYSFDRYGIIAWTAACEMLARRGYDAKQIEAIMRSKWTRWAGDASNRQYGRVTSKDLERFLDDPHNQCTIDAVNKLVAGTTFSK